MSYFIVCPAGEAVHRLVSVHLDEGEDWLAKKERKLCHFGTENRTRSYTILPTEWRIENVVCYHYTIPNEIVIVCLVEYMSEEVWEQ